MPEKNCNKALLWKIVGLVGVPLLVFGLAVYLHINDRVSHLDAIEDRERDRALAVIEGLSDDIHDLTEENRREHEDLKRMILDLHTGG